MGRALLLLASGLTIVSGIIQKTMTERQAGILPARGSDYAYEQQARSLSNAMLDAVVQQLILDRDWDPPSGGSVSIPGELTEGRGSIMIYDQNSSSYPPDHDAGDPNTWGEFKLLIVTQAIVDEEGTQNEYVATTEATMVRDSFSKYSYFTNFEPEIWFVDGDEITGPVHTNGNFHMKGSPVFNGKVTSPNDYEAHSNGADPVFNGGSDFNARVKEPPTQYQLDELAAAASSDGLQFSNPISIEMQYNNGNNTGTIVIEEHVPGTNPVYTLSEAQYNGKIISSSALIEVAGMLKGQLTIHSEDEIEIMGDIEYSKNPLLEPSTDILGLVSEGNVKLDEHAHDYNGDGQDVNIHASVMALNDSFYVENYNSGSHRGDINLLGGLIQEQRGPVGTFGYYGTTGFSKNYQYDQRLLELVPPNFPRESIFEFGYWKDTVVLRETSEE